VVALDYLSYTGKLDAVILEFTVSVGSGIWTVMVGAVLATDNHGHHRPAI
jgi:hypothetical protein